MKRSTARAAIGAVALTMISSIGCQKGPARPVPSPSPFSQRPAGRIVFLSTQLNPVEEANKMRSDILAGFPGAVDFRPNDSAFFSRQVDALLQADPGQSILLGALHGEFAALWEAGRLRSLDDISARLADRGFAESLLKLGRLDGKRLYYIPWMQASYFLVANKKALAYLPAGARADSLSYEDLYRWAAALRERTGRSLLAFPAGQKGLMHRFIQGYLYPSFTGGGLATFRTGEAAEMWAFLKRLWTVVQPSSLDYSTMSEPLLVGDAWLAWDHCARLIEVLWARPDDFVALPAPSGPRGRGFIAVVSGLGIPAGVRDPSDPALLMDYLSRPEVQARMLLDTGFFPTAGGSAEASLPPGLGSLARAMGAQAGSPDAIASLLPVGLGEKGDEYNSIFMLTFSDIVLGGRDIRAVLDANAAKLQAILDSVRAPLWPPDTPAGRPGRIE